MWSAAIVAYIPARTWRRRSVRGGYSACIQAAAPNFAAGPVVPVRRRCISSANLGSNFGDLIKGTSLVMVISMVDCSDR